MRTAAGLTQVQLAQRVGINQSSLSAIEIGDTRYLRGRTIIQLADALNVAPNWLESGRGDPQRPVRASTDEAAALEVFRALKPESREAWLSVGRALVTAQRGRAPTAADPFPAAKQK